MTDNRDALARHWHNMTDHATDGTPFGGPLCNCKNLAPRLAQIKADAAAEALRDAADDLERTREDWYGFFQPLPPEFDYALLDRWLIDTFGFRIDRLSAEYYRRVMTRDAELLRDRAEASGEGQ